MQRNHKIASIFVVFVISLLLYVALAALYPLQAGLLRPRHTWAMQVGAQPLVALAHIGIYMGLLLTFLAALHRNLQSPISNLGVWLGWMAFAFALLFSFPGESADIFDYLFRGRMRVSLAKAQRREAKFLRLCAFARG